MAFARGLATHPDAKRRRAAYEGELEAWATVAVPFAAALNGAKGELGVLNRRRGFADDLEPALRANNVDRETLDAMTEAVVAALPDFRRYLRAKSQLLGHSGGLPWWDLFAPVGRADAIPWTGATDQVRDAFAGFSPDLAALANRAFAESWVDAETRDGKQGGAYCAGVDGDVSRIMMNFDGSQDSDLDARARARSRVPQRGARGAHAVATPAADGAGRDRVDLLRDAAVRARGGERPRRRRAPGAARRAPRGRDADRRRHPQPLPVRDGALRAPAAHDVVGGRHEGGDARRAGGRVRRRTRSRAPPRIHVGREGALLHAVLQLAVHVRTAVRHRALRALPRRPRAVPRRDTTICSRPSAWPTRRRSPVSSVSTCATRDFWSESLAVLVRHIDDYERLAHA